MTSTTLTAALRAAGFRLYSSVWSSSEKDLAQRALSGRTHYADNDTLRFFNARINETRRSDDGLWFALRESLDMPGKGRVHRWCIFDVFGACERTEERSSGRAADALFSALRDGIDWEARTLAELERRATRQLGDATRTLDALQA